MRKAFITTLVELAERDPRILLLTADLGYTVIEPFSERFPERFVNVGVAEQNMLGMATGLAEAGFIPFVYSIATFATLRPYEFIRDGAVLHHLPVRIIGIGGGVEYGHSGFSHHALEDVGALRMQPGLSVIAPADFQQARSALQATWNESGPVYYRLGKDDKNSVPGLDGRFDKGRIQIVRQGTDAVMLTMGPTAMQAVQAAEQLAEKKISCAVAVVPVIAPPPLDALRDLLGQHQMAMSVEAHYQTGGLGSLLAEVIAENTISCRLVRCGINSQPDGLSGSETYLLAKHGLDAASLAQTVQQQMAVLP